MAKTVTIKVKINADRYIGVRIPQSMYAAAIKQAQATRQGLSGFVRDALAQAFSESPTRKGK